MFLLGLRSVNVCILQSGGGGGLIIREIKLPTHRNLGYKCRGAMREGGITTGFYGTSIALR